MAGHLISLINTSYFDLIGNFNLGFPIFSFYLITVLIGLLVFLALLSLTKSENERNLAPNRPEESESARAKNAAIYPQKEQPMVEARPSELAKLVGILSANSHFLGFRQSVVLVCHSLSHQQH